MRTYSNRPAKSIVLKIAAKVARKHGFPTDRMFRRLYATRGKPEQCERCGTTEAAHYDYANLMGHYEDITDYAAMCRSCHWRYDGKIRNIQKAGEIARA